MTRQSIRHATLVRIRTFRTKMQKDQEHPNGSVVLDAKAMIVRRELWSNKTAVWLRRVRLLVGFPLGIFR